LDQHLESPPHVEDLATSSEQTVQLDDVIERIERLNLDEDTSTSQSEEQPRLSHKCPKWLIKTLESVHHVEVGNIRTKSSTRQDDGGDVDNSDSSDVNDIDVSFDCELNLSTNIKPTSFEEATSCDQWKEAMQKEYDALIKNGTWKLVDPPFGTKPIGYMWVYKNKFKSNGSLDKHKARLVVKGFAQK
jgi:hypothetical protein